MIHSCKPKYRISRRIELLEARIAPATFTVSTNADAGAGSLRQAILDANATPNSVGIDLIDFNIGAGGLQTIILSSALPMITDPVDINGYSQTGAVENTESGTAYNGQLKIAIRGVNIPSATSVGLSLGGNGGSSVRGLIFSDFQQNAIEVSSINNALLGNWIGLDPNGLAPLGGGVPTGGGISIVGGDNTTVGGQAPQDRNVISFNNIGLHVQSTTAFTVEGNWFGFRAGDAGGAAPFVPNHGGAILVENSSDGVIGSGAAGNTIGLVISGSAIRISNSTNISVAANRIGYNGDDFSPHRGRIEGNGIEVNLSSGITIEEGNRIVGASNGIRISDSMGGVTVRGNLIGTTTLSTAGAYGNAFHGVLVDGVSTGAITIGGTTPSESNIITGNGGMGVATSAQSLATVRGNSIWRNGGDGISPSVSQAPALAGVLLSALTGPGYVMTVNGSYSGNANSTYAIDFYSSFNSEGEGRVPIGSTTVTTNASGTASISFQVADTSMLSSLLPGGIGGFVTATATDMALGATSRFSAPVSDTPSTFTVVNTSSSGPGSLAAAIIDANNHPGPDTIQFNIAGAGLHTIELTSDLPAITDPVFINGYTQPGSSPNTNVVGTLDTNAVINIAIRGAASSSATRGFFVHGGNSEFRGLNIAGMKNPGMSEPGYAFHLGDEGDNIIAGNFLGTDGTGNTAVANSGSGVFASWSIGNRVGGPQPADRNIISSEASGVDFSAQSNGGIIRGNIFGVGADGTSDIGNAESAILLNGSGKVTVSDNVIANNGNGIRVGTSGFLFSNVTRGNVFSRNTMFGNGGFGSGLGIDLVDFTDSGVNPNDTGDFDTGANELLNFPTLTAVGTNSISGVYSGPVNTFVTIELFSSLSNHASGHGEGSIFIGQMTAMTDASGTATFSYTGAFLSGQKYTATATTVNAGTSEFSAAFPPTYIWDAEGGADTSWFNPLNWSTNTLPGAGDNAQLLGNFTITLPASVSIADFTQSNGIVTGSGNFTVTSAFHWLGGTMSGAGNTVINSGATMTIETSEAHVLDGRSLKNQGFTVHSADSLELKQNASVINEGGWSIEGDVTIFAGTNGGSFANAETGSLVKSTGTGAATFATGIPVSNAGVMNIDSGSLEIEQSFTQTAGTLALQGTTLASPFLNFTGGELIGVGALIGNVVNAGATIRPLAAPGFDITGNYSQTSAGRIELTISGPSTAPYRAIEITGSASLDGTILVAATSYIPTEVDAYSLLTASTVTGTFSTVNLVNLPGMQGIYEPDAFIVRRPVFEPPGRVNLPTIPRSEGFYLPGVDNGEGGGRAGTSVTMLGDINDDSFADFAIGAPGAGDTYVVFGQSDEFDVEFALSELDGSNGFTLHGTGGVGTAITAIGDMNGDGIADIAIGAPSFNGGQSFQGAAYVVFGKSTAFSATVDLSLLNGTDGFQVVGIQAGDRIGTALRSAGDVNNDGVTDLIIGAPNVDGAGANSGAAYVVFGKNGAQFSATVSLATLDGTDGFRIVGTTDGDLFGGAVSSAGDINNDGFDDMVVGAVGANAAYVFFGRGTFAPSISAAAVDGKIGFRISIGPGERIATETLGISVSDAGDLNGDGFDDFVVGSRTGAAPFPTTGNAYVVFGKAKGYKPALDPTTLDGINGFVLQTAALTDGSRVALSSAGDFNNDGYDDIIVGAPDIDGGNGTAYLFFGRKNGFASALSLETLNATTGFRFGGALGNSGVGTSVGGGSDINGDGFSDIIIGATSDEAPVGGAFVIFGHATNVLPDVNPAGSSISFSDVDEDIITIKVTGGKITADMLTFGPNGGLMLVDLTVGDGFKDGANITFKVKPNGGNGTVDVGAIYAEGIRLGKVIVTGDLGQIDAGNGNALKPALKQLVVGSLGARGGTTQIPGTENPLVSDIQGALPKLIVKGNFTNATFKVLGKLGKATIGGDLTGTGAFNDTQSAGLAALGHSQIAPVAGGTTLASSGVNAGSIGSLNIKGSLSSAAVNSEGSIGRASVTVDINKGAVVAAANIGVVKVFGRLIGDDVTPSVIAAKGKLNPRTQGAAIAINSLTVKGEVSHAEILMGYDKTFAPVNGDASVGKVVVTGNWTASSLVAGIKDETTDGFGQGDVPILGFDITPNVFSKIASLIIKGTAEGSDAIGNFYGITAQKIGKAKIAGVALTLDKLLPDDIAIGTKENFRLVEVV